MRENNAKTSRFFHLKKYGFPLFLILLAIFSYGLLIPFLGFYSDDVSMIWISQRFGTSALFLHYLTNRPFLGFLATPLIEMLGFIPWHYEIFYIICRLVCAFSVFWLVGLIWPKNTNASISAALIFLLYPGYTIWPQAVISSRHIILLIMFFCSLGFSVLAIRYPSRRRIWLSLAILLGILNLLLSDYFVFLEFIRPILLWVVLSEIDTLINKKLRSILVNCGALWIAFCLIMYWRLYCFPNLENWYHISVFSNLQTAPIPYLFNLLLQVVRDLWTALGPGMIGFFGLPDVGFEGRLIYLMAVIGLLSLGIGWLVLHKVIQTVDDNRRQNISMIAIGFLWLLFSGPVFWAVGIVPTIEISASRFLLSFLCGVCLVFAGILSLIPNRHFTVVLLSL